MRSKVRLFVYLKIIATGLSFSALSFVASFAAATVLEQAPEDQKALKRCVQLHKLGELPAKQIDKLEQDGEARVWRIQGQRSEFIAFIMGTGARAACQVYKTEKPAARLSSVLHPAKGTIEALVLHGEVCNDDDGCAAALVYREKKGNILAALRTDGCTRGERLRKIRLFPGNHRTLLRTCRHGHSKNEYEEVIQLIHHDGKKARVIGEFDVGRSRVVSKPKGKNKVEVCVHPAPGSVKARGWGPAPKIRVRLPADDTGKGVEESIWSWSIKAGEFVQGKATMKKVRLTSKCHVENVRKANKGGKKTAK